MNLPEVNPEFEALLDYLKDNRGLDLTGYKRGTLMRRFQYRMQTLNIESFESYLQYLQWHSQEYLDLLNDVLINVTGFFRDRDAWDYLATDIIPTIIARKAPDESIRVWSAGCAAGQEIYSLLILFMEALGVEACLKRVQCFATDADESAVQQARKATYSDLEVTEIPPDLLQKYFEQTDQGYSFRSKLRHAIVFGHHNLTEDAPISKIDLLVCRNVLIYFNPEPQTSILARFHFALKNTGFLFLGQTENLINRRQIFTPVNLKHHVYTKGLNLELADHLAITPKPRREQTPDPTPPQSYFWQTAFEMSPFAQLAVDLNGRLLKANEAAHLLFELTLDDWNRPFRELVPGKLAGFYGMARTFYRSHRPVTLQDVEWVTSNSTRYFQITIAPVFNLKKQLLGITLVFLETTVHKQLTEKLEYTDSQLTRVSETLCITESALNTTHLELENIHKEMQFVVQDGHDRKV
jgi:two-component system CheB/CheR fusion protein